MALVAKPEFNTVWAQSGGKTQPSEAKIDAGWTAEIPPFQWENFVQWRQDTLIKYILQRGMPEWSASEDYLGGLSYTVGSDGNQYRAIQTSGPSATVVNPVTNTSFSHWRPVTKPGAVGVAGLIELASVSEQAIGTSESRASTPLGVAAMFTGMVTFFAMATPPDGWLIADGSAVSRTTYARLFARIGTIYGIGNGSTTFNVPDLRGEFIRGWDINRGVDPSRPFSSLQLSQNLFHAHSAYSIAAGEHNHGILAGTDNAGPFGEANGNGPTGIYYTQNAGNHTHGIVVQGDGGNEARPRNVAMLPAIKY